MNQSGYLDETGKLVLPFIYDRASAFDNGLARVRIGSREGWIDPHGNEIMMWDAEND
ncbi:MAG: WG repeat-containing protein [Clostridia bacterium]|nr:WG repeat-containing protein [Clostridia bacterium]